MEQDQVSIGPEGRTSYWCVTGHDLPAGTILDTTEVVSLDEGAVLRQCREHGAPVSIRIAPVHRD